MSFRILFFLVLCTIEVQSQSFFFSSFDSLKIFFGDTIVCEEVENIAAVDSVCEKVIVFSKEDSFFINSSLPYTFRRAKGFVNDPDQKNIAVYPVYDIQDRNVFPEFRKTFLFYLWILLLALFAFLKIVFHQKWKNYWTDFKNINIALQSFRDQPSGLLISDIVFNLLFVFSISVCLEAVFFANKNLTLSEYFSLYWVIVLGMSVLTVFRVLFLRMFAWVLPFGDQLLFYIYNLNIVNKISIVVWLFLVMLLLSSFNVPYQGWYVIMAVFLIGLVVLGWYKGIGIINLKKNDSEFIFILYFCVFEILVVLMFAKFLLEFFS